MENNKATKKPIYKQWWFWAIVAVIVLAAVGSAAGNSKDNQQASSSAPTLSVVEDMSGDSSDVESSESESVANEVSISETEELRAKFQEDMGDASVLFDHSVRNDTTGRWRLARLSSKENIVDHAIDYYDAYFESDDEVHMVVNFALKTTSVIARYGNFLDVAVHEYVDGEEHDAKKLGSGLLLKEYWVFLDSGEIQDITDAE